MSCSANWSHKISQSTLLRCSTLCSASRSPTMSESTCFDIVGVRFSKRYLRVDPKPGWAYRTGSEGGHPELRNSNFSDVRQNHRKTNFPRGFLEESFCGKCSWRAYATFHRRTFNCLPRGSVFFLESPILLLILCADFELGAECLPLGRLPGSGLNGRFV